MKDSVGAALYGAAGMTLVCYFPTAAGVLFGLVMLAGVIYMMAGGGDESL